MRLSGDREVRCSEVADVMHPPGGPSFACATIGGAHLRASFNHSNTSKGKINSVIGGEVYSQHAFSRLHRSFKVLCIYFNILRATLLLWDPDDHFELYPNPDLFPPCRGP